MAVFGLLSLLALASGLECAGVPYPDGRCEKVGADKIAAWPMGSLVNSNYPWLLKVEVTVDGVKVISFFVNWQETKAHFAFFFFHFILGLLCRHSS